MAKRIYTRDQYLNFICNDPEEINKLPIRYRWNRKFLLQAVGENPAAYNSLIKRLKKRFTIFSIFSGAVSVLGALTLGLVGLLTATTVPFWAFIVAFVPALGILDVASIIYKREQKFVLKAVKAYFFKISGKIFEALPTIVKMDKKFVSKALAERPGILEFIPKELLSNESFMLDMIKKNPGIKEFVLSAVKKHKETATDKQFERMDNILKYLIVLYREEANTEQKEKSVSDTKPFQGPKGKSVKKNDDHTMGK